MRITYVCDEILYIFVTAGLLNMRSQGQGNTLLNDHVVASRKKDKSRDPEAWSK